MSNNQLFISEKISKKDMIKGCIYLDKKQNELIYLGYYNYFRENENYAPEEIYYKKKKPTKKYIFKPVIKDKYNEYITFSSYRSLKKKLSVLPDKNFPIYQVEFLYYSEYSYIATHLEYQGNDKFRCYKNGFKKQI
ncbi:MAG: hypothetical protein GY849_02525 [Deltaproteobacteria bacterium]|nr:hypothetical protein [Deltaproteobacteria bacterium]